MFGSCPCVQARHGVFVLVACAYAAMWSPAFLGADFGALIAAFIAAPLDPPFAFAVWAAAAVAGAVMLGIGIRENLQDGHGAPVLASLVVIFACAVALHKGWYMPRPIWDVIVMHGTSWGVYVAPIAFRGFHIAVIAACVTNLVMALAAQMRRMRRAAATRRPAQGQAANAQRIEALTAELAEARAVLTFPGVRAALLHTLHSDHHANAEAAERRARDEIIGKLTTIYQRIGVER